MEEEMEAERGYRAKAERQRADLAKELEDLAARLEESGGATAAQIELNKKREAEINKMRQELEENIIQREAALGTLKKKHADAINALEEQMESQNKIRVRLEKDKQAALHDAAEAKKLADKMLNEKSMAERDAKQAQSALRDNQMHLEEMHRTQTDLNHAKQKLTTENQDLNRQLVESDHQISQLSQIRASLTTQLQDAQRMADDEAKERATLSVKARNVENERNALRENLEDEQAAKEDVMRQLSRMTGECALWRAKYESEAVSKIDELENAKTKLQARLVEAEDTMEDLRQRCENLEKTKQRLMTEIEDTQLELDRSNQNAAKLEKKTQHVDKIIGEWKLKADDLASLLDEARKGQREAQSELCRAKAVQEEVLDQHDGLQRENKNLALEVKDLLDQIGEGGRSLHEVERDKRRLEGEKEELAMALEEAEVALEQEENRNVRAQHELAQARQDVDRRIKEKAEEFDNVRRTQQRLIESLQATLEAEGKAKAELLRVKKKLETDIHELEMSLDHVSRTNVDLQSNAKKASAQLRDVQQQLDDERQEKDKVRDDLAASERKSNAMANECEECKTYLEQAERAKKQLQLDITDCTERMNDAVAQRDAMSSLKRQMEGDMAALQGELEEYENELRNADEKCKRALVDAMKLAEEVRMEQERAVKEEAGRKSAEAIVKELKNRVEEAEANALRGGRKALERLELKVRCLTADLDNEQRCKNDFAKNWRRSERRMKEIEFQQDEERKNFERFQVKCTLSNALHHVCFLQHRGVKVYQKKLVLCSQRNSSVTLFQSKTRIFKKCSFMQLKSSRLFFRDCKLSSSTKVLTLIFI